MQVPQNHTFTAEGTGLDAISGRIIMESVPGRQITLAHIIASPDPILYRKLGLDPTIDYRSSAIGILCQTPYETAIITADIALKAAAIRLGFVDRFSGTLVVTGTISDVTIAWEQSLAYASSVLGFDVCQITKA
ncbi:BMC domain-containing protein [uncultured Megasphaera sp.]|uniref:BMC domain-containing protein n=1 Tax=uncultured Megasphaera sp. TaxID=165188 RepID=UPI00265A0360|nr:BMC domain-containing protein [uncultured Megasphaera sp.]